MLNNKKVEVMSKIAVYEHGEGKETLRLNNYIKNDYTSAKLLSSLPLGIVTAILIVALIFCYDTEWPFKMISAVGGVWTIVICLASFFVFVVAYGFLSAFMFNKKYESYRGDLRRYSLNLSRLERIYAEEELDEQTDRTAQ